MKLIFLNVNVNVNVNHKCTIAQHLYCACVRIDNAEIS